MGYWAKPSPRFTFFHLLWLMGTAGASLFTYSNLSGLILVLRISVLVIGTFVTFLVLGVVIVFFVSKIMIPRVKPGSTFSYDAACFMLHITGKNWDDLDSRRDLTNHTDEKTGA